MCSCVYECVDVRTIVWMCVRVCGCAYDEIPEKKLKGRERRGGLGKNNSGRFSGRFGGRAVNKQERMEASTLKKRRR